MHAISKPCRSRSYRARRTQETIISLFVIARTGTRPPRSEPRHDMGTYDKAPGRRVGGKRRRPRQRAGVKRGPPPGMVRIDCSLRSDEKLNTFSVKSAR